MGPTVTYVESLIAIERAYINTNHPDFLGAAGAMANLEQETRKKKKIEALKRRQQLLESKQKADLIAAHEAVVVGVDQENNISSRESLLNYFFGSNKNEKPAAGLQEMMTKAQSAPFVSVNSMMQNEIIKKLEQTSLEEEATDREELETQLIRMLNSFYLYILITHIWYYYIGTLINSYFNIVRKNIQDLVPKSIMHLLVNHSRESVQNRLVSALYKEECFNELLQEDEMISRERERCKTMLNVYKQAFDLIKNSM